MKVVMCYEHYKYISQTPQAWKGKKPGDFN
jgi:hypothetical protein